jgi:Flp pilus assembly protein TadG
MKELAMNRAPKQKGAAAVEFAFLVIPLLVMLTGITEFGRAMYYYNTIAKGARDAVRLMSTQTPTDPDYGTLTAAAKCTAVYGNPSCTGQELVPGLTTAMVSICDPASCAGSHASVPTGTGVVNLVTVTVGGPNNPYVFQSMAPFVPALFGIPDITFAAINATMRQVI